MNDTSIAARYPSLRDRPVLVTGGATGVGAAIVEALARQGARVGFVDLEASPGRALAERLGTCDKVAHAPAFVCADLTRTAARKAAIRELREACGQFAGLVNNAANDQRHAFEATTPAAWDAGMAVNLKQQFFVAQAVATDMRGACGGSIVNLDSISWRLKMNDMPVYAIAKSAVQGLTRTLARELGPHRVRVNSVVPGWVMTERQREVWMNSGASSSVMRLQCVPEPIGAQHVASMVLFLLADDSALCSAQDFIVDGGAS